MRTDSTITGPFAPGSDPNTETWKAAARYPFKAWWDTLMPFNLGLPEIVLTTVTLWSTRRLGDRYLAVDTRERLLNELCLLSGMRLFIRRF